MEVQNLKIDEIKPYENNPRNNLDAVDATANSIKEFGWQQPIVVDKDMAIIAGHTRYLTAKKLAEWDLVQLDEELESILNIDMEDYGFDLDNVEEDIDVTDKDLSETFSEKFELKVTCDNENQLEELYNELTERKFECSILT